jgi:hypothetical protein
MSELSKSNERGNENEPALQFETREDAEKALSETLERLLDQRHKSLNAELLQEQDLAPEVRALRQLRKQIGQQEPGDQWREFVAHVSLTK